MSSITFWQVGGTFIYSLRFSFPYLRSLRVKLLEQDMTLQLVNLIPYPNLVPTYI